jgi:hypothetical protein
MFLGLLDPDPLVRGKDPSPALYPFVKDADPDPDPYQMSLIGRVRIRIL